MSEIRYDNQFNANEWFIIFSLFVGIILMFWLPRRFSKRTIGVYFMCGVFFGFYFDHTLSVYPVRFYVINDSSDFKVIDFFSHVMYGPLSYLFFYLYDFFNVKSHSSLVYILVWAFISTGIERLAVAAGVFHYRHGFTIFYSFVIYLFVLSVWVLLHSMIKRYGNKQF